MRNVSKSFQTTSKVLDGVTLRLRPGQIHALMGENGAGKSTLMKCMFGIFRMDEGEIYYQGEKVTIKNPFDALQRGIAMVHQELQPVLPRSVAENIFLGRLPVKKKCGIRVVDHEKLYADTAALLNRLGLSIDPREKMENLNVSRRQLVEIAKAVSVDCKVLILDEPTSSLTANEVETLFSILADLKDRGVAIVYISHKMDEILRISDEVTILRDGKFIGTWEANALTTDEIIRRMVGRELTSLYPKRKNVPGDVLLEVRDFNAKYSAHFHGINFSLRRGEILGVAGLTGAQRTELMEAIFGVRSATGQLFLNGEEIAVRKPEDAIAHGFALLTEERLASGIMGVLPVTDNFSVASLDQYLAGGFCLDERKIDRTFDGFIERLHIKLSSKKRPISNLSGGNQQKVLLARWLANDPDILILDEPTRGIDIGAKHEIYEIIVSLAEKGKSILLISGEMGELIGLADRIMVMCDGRVTGFVSGEEATQDNIMRLATQFASKGEV